MPRPCVCDASAGQFFDRAAVGQPAPAHLPMSSPLLPGATPRAIGLSWSASMPAAKRG